MKLPLNVLFGVEFQSDEGRFHHSRGNDVMREGEQKNYQAYLQFLCIYLSDCEFYIIYVKRAL